MIRVLLDLGLWQGELGGVGCDDDGDGIWSRGAMGLGEGIWGWR